MIKHDDNMGFKGSRVVLITQVEALFFECSILDA